MMDWLFVLAPLCLACGHSLDAHTAVTNDGCMVEACRCDAEQPSSQEDYEAQTSTYDHVRGGRTQAALGTLMERIG
jgi:hypothetical protein